MGCLQSTNINDDPKKIDYEFAWVSVLEIDEVFTDLRACLSTVEKLRSGIEDNREALIYKTYAITLKDPSLREATKIMFWILSANHEGKIGNCEPKITTRPPFITLKCKNYDMNTYWDKFSSYLKTVSEGPEEILKELDEFQRLVEKMEELAQGGMGRALEHLNSVPRARATVETTKNINKVRKQIPKIQRVKDVLQQARMEMEDMMNYLQESIKSSDEIGMKGFRENKLTAEQIIGYHPGPFQNQEDVENLKKIIKKY